MASTITTTINVDDRTTKIKKIKSKKKKLLMLKKSNGASFYKLQSRLR